MSEHPSRTNKRYYGRRFEREVERIRNFLRRYNRTSLWVDSDGNFHFDVEPALPEAEAEDSSDEEAEEALEGADE